MHNLSLLEGYVLIVSPSIITQTFSGTQNVSSLQNEKDEAWRVNVCIQGCDLDHGYLCGTMEALNVPMADTPVSWIFHPTNLDSWITLCTSKLLK